MTKKSITKRKEKHHNNKWKKRGKKMYNFAYTIRTKPGRMGIATCHLFQLLGQGSISICHVFTLRNFQRCEAMPHVTCNKGHRMKAISDNERLECAYVLLNCHPCNVVLLVHSCGQTVLWINSKAAWVLSLLCTLLWHFSSVIAFVQEWYNGINLLFSVLKCPCPHWY